MSNGFPLEPSFDVDPVNGSSPQCRAPRHPDTASFVKRDIETSNAGKSTGRGSLRPPYASIPESPSAHHTHKQWPGPLDRNQALGATAQELSLPQIEPQPARLSPMPPGPHAWILLPFRESVLSLRLARWQPEPFFFLLDSLLASLQFPKTCGQPLEFLTKPQKFLVFAYILLRLFQFCR